MCEILVFLSPTLATFSMLLRVYPAESDAKRSVHGCSMLWWMTSLTKILFMDRQRGDREETQVGSSTMGKMLEQQIIQYCASLCNRYSKTSILHLRKNVKEPFKSYAQYCCHLICEYVIGATVERGREGPMLKPLSIKRLEHACDSPTHVPCCLALTITHGFLHPDANRYNEEWLVSASVRAWVTATSHRGGDEPHQSRTASCSNAAWKAPFRSNSIPWRWDYG